MKDTFDYTLERKVEVSFDKYLTNNNNKNTHTHTQAIVFSRHIYLIADIIVTFTIMLYVNPSDMLNTLNYCSSIDNVSDKIEKYSNAIYYRV